MLTLTIWLFGKIKCRMLTGCWQVGCTVLMLSIWQWLRNENIYQGGKTSSLRKASFVFSCQTMTGATYMVSVLGQQQYPKAFHAWASIQNVNCFIKIILVFQQDGELWYKTQKREIIYQKFISMFHSAEIKNKNKLRGKQSHWILWGLKRSSWNHRDFFL